MSLCSSNASFYEKLGVHKSSPDGEMMRLLEYQIEPSTIIDPVTAKKMFDHQLKDNYGHAGPIYVQYLVNELEEALGCLHAVQERIDREMKLTSRERFWSAVIACNLTGGLIARNLGLIDYDMKAIYEWALTMLADVRQDIAAPVNNSASIIGDFINRHIRNALIVDGNVDNRTKLHAAPLQEPYGDLIIRYEPDRKRLFIVAKAFRDDCVETQIGYKDTLNELKSKGIFVGAKNTRMSKGMKITSPGVHALEFDCTVPDFLDLNGLVESLSASVGDQLQD